MAELVEFYGDFAAVLSWDSREAGFWHAAMHDLIAKRRERSGG